MEIHVFEILSMASAGFLVVSSSEISAISLEGVNVLDPEASISLTPNGEIFPRMCGNPIQGHGAEDFANQVLDALMFQFKQNFPRQTS